MSEALNHQPEPVPPPMEGMAQDQNHENDDFSKVGPEIAVSYLFSELRDPSTSQLHGQALAVAIIKRISADPSKGTTSHEARLVELIRTPIDDELWDEKSEHDEVFMLLENILRDNKVRSLAEQRKAALHLYNLRGSFPDLETKTDEEWKDIIERLFT